MKLIITWIINTIIILPLKIIALIIKLIYKIIKNIYGNNLDLEYIETMDGRDFENFTKLLLEKNGFKNVRVSQESNDYGIDVLATKNKYNYAIQCKRYSKTVGIKAVQEAKSGCIYYNYDIPVVFTNNTFSSGAINLAKNTNVELWDRDTLHYYLKKSKILTKSLPFYYPLISGLVTFYLGYYYFEGHKQYLLVLFLINLFLLISIIFKIFKDKTKAPFKDKEPEYNIHDYHDTIQ